MVSTPSNVVFQSPSGDSLFSDVARGRLMRNSDKCFNPLAGIRCFLTIEEHEAIAKGYFRSVSIP